MKTYALLIAAWFRVPPRHVLPLLTDDEFESLAVEAMLSRTVIVLAKNSRFN